MSAKSILLVSHELSRSGAPSSLLRQARYLCEAGYRVVVWTLADGPLGNSFRSLGVAVVCVGSDFSEVRRRVRSEGADFALVVCNTYKTYRYATAFAAAGRPVAWFIRETANLLGPLASDREFAQALRGFYNLYTVSAYARDYIASINPHVRYFNNSVEDRFSAFSSMKPSEIRFGFIGAITKRKGIADLISAYCALPPSPVTTSLRIAGRFEGTEEGTRLRRLTAGRPDVIWLGEVAGSTREEFFNSVDVLCVPSRDEPSGLTLLEGAMYGKALLATDHVGANYVIGEANGIVVPVSDIGRGLQSFLNRVEDLAAMQMESRQRYLHLATPELERDEVLKMVLENLENPPPPGTMEVRPVRQFFRKEDVGETHWRFRIWGVPVLKCRKISWLKCFIRWVLVGMGVDPGRLGYATEE